MELPDFETVTAGRFFDELDPQDKETVRYACADSDYALRLYHLLTAGSINTCPGTAALWSRSSPRPPCIAA